MTAPESPPRRTWLALAALSWLAAGALYLTLPPAPDQFHHAYMGWRWIEGDLPYHDFIDMNWPGTIGLHAVAVWIFGVHLWSWRAADFVLFAMSAVFLADLVRRAEGVEAGRYCLVLSPLIYVGMNDWIAGQHDMSAAHFLVIALWFHVRAYERPDWRWQIGTGLFVGAAMLCKPTVGVIGVLLPLQAIWMRASVRTVLAHSALLAVAALATVAAAMAGVVALGTPLSDLVDAIYTYNVATQYLPVDMGLPAGGAPSRAAARTLYSRLWAMSTQSQAQWWIAASLLSLPAFLGWLRPRHRSVAASAPLVLWLTGVLSFVIQSRGLGYHLSPCVPALTAGVTTAMSRAAGRVLPGQAERGKGLRSAYVVVAALWIAARIAVNFHSLPAALATGDYAIHLARFNAGDELRASDVVAFARRVEATDSSGCLLAIGTVSAVNYLSERRQPTRFYYFPVIAKAREPMPMAQRWVTLWESDLKRANCRYVLIKDTIDRDWLPGQTRAAQALRTLLLDYRRVGTLGATGGVLVYERRTSAP